MAHAIHLDDEDQSNRLNGRLHFCIFENGEHDLIYVGTNYGMWSQGEFELSIGADGMSPNKVVFTGRIEHLVYEGVFLDMGNFLKEQPDSNIGIAITRITGWIK